VKSKQTNVKTTNVKTTKMDDKKKQELNLDFTPDVLTGTYSNLVVISHSPSEFIIDFAQAMPGTKNPTVRQRIVMAPMHAKRFMMALQDNVNKFEHTFGAISEPQMPGMSDTVPYDIIGKA
jgi:hypothetical protein